MLGTSAQVRAQQTQPPQSNHYEEGLRLYNRGLFQEAAHQFKLFLLQHPENQLNESAAFYRARAKAKVDSTNAEIYFEHFIQDYPGSDLTTEMLVELGKRAEQKNNFQAAIDYYHRAIDYGLKKKDAPRVYYWMAEAAVSYNHKDEARKYFLQLADEYPKSDWAPKALYARGRLYLSENNYDASTKAFELLRKRYPNDPMTRRIGTALGESYYQEQKYKQAIEALQNAMPYLNDEMKSKAVYLIAESYNYLDDYKNASKYYLQYINMNKGTDKERIAHYGLGWVYYKQKIYHWAADAFDKAAKGDDEMARKALYYKGVNDKLGGRYQKALASFREFGDRFKKGVWVEHGYYEWAMTAYEMGIYDESIEVLLRLVRNGEDLNSPAKIYTLLGEAYFANKEYTRALQAFDQAEKVVDIDPSIKRDARFHKAWVLYRNQAYKQAQPLFQEVYEEAPGDSLGAQALFWSADSYYNMDNFGPASRLFADYVKEYPNSDMLGAARYSLGWSYFKMGDYNKAVGPLRTFLNNYNPPSIALFPYDTDTKLRLGDAYFALGEYDQAINYYQKAIGAEPGGDYAMYQIANSHYRAGDTYEAVTTFRKLLRIYPYTKLREQAQYNIAYVYFLSNNYTQAVKEFETVIEKYPNTNWAARAQYSIGDAYYNAGDYDQSIAAYKKVMNNYPKSNYLIEAVNGIQYAQLAAGKQDSSSAILEDFLARHPRTSTADQLRFRQAENLLQSGDYKRAIKSFRQYLRVTNSEERIPDAYYNLAEAYKQTDQTQQAIEAYQKIVNNYQNSDRAAPSLVALGQIATENGNYTQSYQYYQQLTDKGAQYKAQAQIGMGDARLEQGQLDEARQHYEQALQIDPNSDMGKMGLGKVSLRQSQYDKAQQIFSEIAQKNTTEIGAEAQYMLGQTLQKQGNCQDAIKAYSKVKVLYEAFSNWVSKAQVNSARCHIKLGNRGDAQNLLNAVIKNYPGTDAAKEAQKLLNSNPN